MKIQNAALIRHSLSLVANLGVIGILVSGAIPNALGDPTAISAKDSIKGLTRLSADGLDLKNPAAAFAEAQTRLNSKIAEVEQKLSAVTPAIRLDAYKNLSFGFSTLQKTRNMPDPGPPVTGPENGVVPLDQQHFEAVVGDRNFLPVVFLQQGVLAQRSVGRVAFRTLGGGGWGTGFLVSKSLMLTNNHVIPSQAAAAQYELQMNYQISSDGQIGPIQRFNFDPNSCFYSSPDTDLDYTLIRVRPNSIPIAAAAGGAAQGTDLFGFIPLQSDLLYSTQQAVNIIQHPGGRPKEIALQANLLVGVYDKVIRYTTDTEDGSSGSPVFNNNWTLIGLHHAVGDKAPDGTVNNNEGIRIDRIIADIKSKAPPDVLAELGL